MTVFANSGGEKLMVGDLDLGEFDVSAFRYPKTKELPEVRVDISLTPC